MISKTAEIDSGDKPTDAELTMKNSTILQNSIIMEQPTDENACGESDVVSPSSTSNLREPHQSVPPDFENSGNPHSELEEEDLDGDKQGVEKEKIESDSNSEQIDTPFDPTKIKIDTKEPSLDVIMSRIRHNEIDLNPDFQRNPNIWDNKHKSRLIESLLLRIPLPVFYMAADKDDNWQVVDGLQRLDAMKNFILDKSFSLRGLEYLNQFEKKSYDELPQPMKRRINETQISCHIIDPGTPSEVMFNIFKRINTGGKPLSLQEIRHALYPGKARDLINDLADSDEFKKATDHSVNSKRMADRECVLRFAAFYSKKLSTYNGDLDGFLSKFMKDLNENYNQYTNLSDDFKRVMKLAIALFGDEAFRKPKISKGTVRSPINKPLFESWSVNLAHIPETQYELLIERKKKLIDNFHLLIKDEKFFESISLGTQTINKVQTRFGRIKELIAEVLK